MGERALVNKKTDQIQARRREIQIRREKEYALAQYKKMKRKAQQKKSLPSKEPVSVNHAIFFTVCLGVASVVIPQLGGLALIFSIIILGHHLGAKFDLFEEKKESEVIDKRNISDEKMLRMVQNEVVKLSSKKKSELPVAKTAQGLTFKNEDGHTITQFDWRQLTE